MLASTLRAEQVRPLSADLDEGGAVGARGDRGVERIEGGGGVGVALHPLPELPDLDGGRHLIARRQPAHPAGAAIDGVILARGRTFERYRAEARRVVARVAHLLEWRQDGADVEERPRRSPVDEIIAQRERADRRAGDAVATFIVLGIGDAGEQRQIGRQVLAAVNAGRERTRRAERADAIVAIDLLVDPSSTLPSTRLVIIWLKRCPARSLIDPALEPGQIAGGAFVLGVDVGLGDGVGEADGVGVGSGVGLGVGVGG